MQLLLLFFLLPPLGMVLFANWFFWRKRGFKFHLTDYFALPFSFTPIWIFVSKAGGPATPVEWALLVCLHLYFLAAMALGKRFAVEENDQRFISFFCMICGSVIGFGIAFLWALFLGQFFIPTGK